MKQSEKIMILSMTGFGRGSASAKGRMINVEVKSLNSKQLDLIIKLPNRYRKLEGELRNLLASRVERGKVEAIISMEVTAHEDTSHFNIELIRQYKEEIEQIDKSLGIATPADWNSLLLRMPDAMKGDDPELSEEEEEAFRKAAVKALDGLLAFRRAEGEKLYGFFKTKIDNIRRLLADVAPHEEGRVAKIKARMLDQLDKLSGVEIDAGRLEQELIYYIEKLDISEEKQRLTAHLDYFLNTMGDKESLEAIAVGKKLGFISQEMGREINTLGSKSNNAEMQIIVVKMKDELEQIKEQVLNVL